jgi:hypothetical protein
VYCTHTALSYCTLILHSHYTRGGNAEAQASAEQTSDVQLSDGFDEVTNL